MTLDDLKVSAPRTFDKVLVDLIAAVQAGGQPIVDAASTAEVGGAMLAIIQRINAIEGGVADAAQAIAAFNVQVIDLMQRVETIEAANRMLADEAAKRLGKAESRAWNAA